MMAAVMAQEPYFFWVSLIDFTIRTLFVFLLVLNDVHDLPVNDVAATDNAEDRKYGHKDAFGAQPLIQLEP
jgi:hypothetical protein